MVILSSGCKPKIEATAHCEYDPTAPKPRLSGRTSEPTTGVIQHHSPQSAISESLGDFRPSWESVYRSVEWFVEWGLTHRQLGGIQALGVDEIHWGHGLRADNFLTVV